MFTVAILLGVYSYVLFFLGITGYFYKDSIAFFTVLFFVFTSLWGLKAKKMQIPRIPQITNKITLAFALLLLLQAFVNVIGALGPELSFDALWYHLTLPKLYLINHAIYHIPGGLLYYSDMPKLTEMFYAGALALGNEITAKIVHFLFGIVSLIALYLFSRKYFSPFISLIAVVIFYSNLVVAWESTTAYVDLARAFFEIMALWGFTNWLETKKNKWLSISAVMIGLAITTKLLAIGSLIIFSVLIVVAHGRTVSTFKDSMLLLIIALVVPFPWFIFAYVHTGNPVYPFFSEIYKIVPEPFSLSNVVGDIWMVFMRAADPISPLYLLFFPLLLFVYKKLDKRLAIIVLYSILAIVVWYFTPRTGGGRFLLPYLPAMSIVCAGILSVVLKKNKQYYYLGTILVVIIAFVSISSIVYRFIANSKYIPVIIGQESKSEFLTKNLNFTYADFYDTDNYFKNNIQKNERVLLYGFHNLYYVDFSFIDSSWAKPGDTFHYIAVHSSKLPEQYKDWQMIYSNAKTAVKLYKHKSIKEHGFVYAFSPILYTVQ